MNHFFFMKDHSGLSQTLVSKWQKAKNVEMEVILYLPIIKILSQLDVLRVRISIHTKHNWNTIDMRCRVL